MQYQPPQMIGSDGHPMVTRMRHSASAVELPSSGSFAGALAEGSGLQQFSQFGMGPLANMPHIGSPAASAQVTAAQWAQ